MNKIKVAVLEDDKHFLKELISNLKEINFIDIIAYAETSEIFIELVKEKSPDLLLMDIHLSGESINGIQIANILKLPVIFLSDERRNYLERIDDLKLLGTFPVEEIGKTPNSIKLKTIIESFLPKLQSFQKSKKIKIKPVNEDEVIINPSEVTFISSRGKYHDINFVDKNSISTINKSFDYFINNGFDNTNFFKLGRNYLINFNKSTYNSGIIEAFFYIQGIKKSQHIKVQSEYAKLVKSYYLK